MNVRYLPTAVLTAVVVLTAPLPGDGSEPGDSAAIRRLVAQLGSDSHEAREDAEKRLAEIGAPAVSAIWEATKSGDPEVARRARRLMEQLPGDAFPREVRKFVDEGTPATALDLPGWDALRELLDSDDRPARTLYARMFLAEDELLRATADAKAAVAGDDEAVGAARRKYLALDAERAELCIQSLRQRFATGGVRKRLEADRRFKLNERQEARVMALVFARSQLPPEWTAGRASDALRALTIGVVVGAQNRPVGRPHFWHRLTEDTAIAGHLRRIVAAWCMSTIELESRQAALQAAMTLHQKRVSVAMAERILAEPRGPVGASQSDAFLAIHALMLWGGGERHVALVEPFLTDAGERRLGGWKGNPLRKSILMREWALTALLRMTGQKPAAYGRPRSMTTYCTVARWAEIHLYLTDQAWDAALGKWRAWSSKNLPASTTASTQPVQEPGGTK